MGTIRSIILKFMICKLKWVETSFCKTFSFHISSLTEYFCSGFKMGSFTSPSIVWQLLYLHCIWKFSFYNLFKALSVWQSHDAPMMPDEAILSAMSTTHSSLLICNSKPSVGIAYHIFPHWFTVNIDGDRQWCSSANKFQFTTAAESFIISNTS